MSSPAIPVKKLGIPYFPYTYGIVHAVVDAASVMVIFSTGIFHGLSMLEVFLIVMIYDALAFAGQAPIGLMLDKFRLAKPTGVGGIALVGVSIIFMKIEPVTAMVFAAIGNAAFHVGIGALSLYVKPGRATPPGIYVAPGNIGLAVGIFMGKSGFMIAWPFLALLGMSLLASLIQKDPEIPEYKEPVTLDVKWPVLILLVLLFSISIRSYVGQSGGASMPSMIVALFILAFAGTIGKALGGVLSDKFGWILVSVGALLISAPFVAFGAGKAAPMIVGLMIFQMTMPVTLVAAWSIFPSRPGFVFGLNCVALFVGLLPLALFRQKLLPYSPALIMGMIFLSAAAVYVALSALKHKVPMKFGRPETEISISQSAIEGKEQLSQV